MKRHPLTHGTSTCTLNRGCKIQAHTHTYGVRHSTERDGTPSDLVDCPFIDIGGECRPQFLMTPRTTRTTHPQIQKGEDCCDGTIGAGIQEQIHAH